MIKNVPLVLALLVLTSPAWAQATQRPTVEERLIKLETRVDEGFKAVNQRIDGLDKSLNKRIDDVNRRFDDLQFWLQFIFGVQVLIMGGLIAQWLLMWKRIIGTEKILETHLTEKEEKELISIQREEISLLKERLSRLEGASV